jgi:alpha-D-xyloside xylohydrolase
VLPLGSEQDRPDYDYLQGLTLQCDPSGTGDRWVTVTAPDGRSARFAVQRNGSGVTARCDSVERFTLSVMGRGSVTSSGGVAELSW